MRVPVDAMSAGETSVSSTKSYDYSLVSNYLANEREDWCAGARDIYEAFTSEQRVRAFTQSEATIKPEVGSDFAMFGGSIVGVQRELAPSSRIVQDWRFNSWEQGLFSKVRALVTVELCVK